MHVRNSLAPRLKTREQAQAVCCPNNLGPRLTLGNILDFKAAWVRGGREPFVAVMCAQ